MSRRLLLLSGSVVEGGLAVAFGGDAAALFEPANINGGVPIAPQAVTVPYGGDGASAFDPTGVLTTANEPLSVGFGGDASAGYPVALFVTTSTGDLIPAGSDPENRVRIWRFADAAALEANAGTELGGSHSRAWVTVLSDAGSFSVSLQNTDDDVDAIDYGDLIRCDIDGAASFVGVVEAINRALIAPGEEHDQLTTVAGRGVVAEWERAIVGPPTAPGSKLFGDVRHFGWMSAELLDQTWPSGRRQFRQDTLADGYEAKHGTPLGWPDPSGWWIWSAPALPDGSTLPAGVLAPTDPPLHAPGVSYFRNGFGVAADTDVAIYAAADDAFELYVDGVPIGGNDELNGWREAFRADITLEAGDHIIAVRAENYDRAAATNTAGLIVAVYSLDADGNDDTLLLRTGGADWEVQHYPSRPPGFTVGTVIRLLLEGAQADGELLDWSLDFDDATDSDGNPWPTSQQFSFSVGDDLLVALRQLAETHIDFLIDRSAKVLRAWRYGQAGVHSSAATASLVDGLDELTFEGRA